MRQGGDLFVGLIHDIGSEEAHEDAEDEDREAGEKPEKFRGVVDGRRGDDERRRKRGIRGKRGNRRGIGVHVKL